MPYCPGVASVLVVEDDPLTRGGLIRELSGRGHAVSSAGTALDGIRSVHRERPDVIILDLGLPDLDGAAALKMIRGICEAPVIVATARDTERDVIALLNAGADDYLIKPFSADHLDARLRAVLRRAGQPEVSAPVTAGGLSIDMAGRRATLDGRPLDLTRREFDLLGYLAGRAGTVVSRRELLARVWRQPYTDDKTVDVHLSLLRRKLGETAARPRYLHTVRGVGFRLDPPA